MSRQTVTARTTPMVVALCLAICFTLAPRSLAAADPETSASPAVPASPLLQALAYAPRDAVSVTFTDWAGLKAQHGGTGVTSASPLADRQALLLEIGRSEAVLAPLGLDLLDAWPSAWGWDSTDLAWQLGPVTPTSTPVVLRFRDAWDPAPFMAQLDRHGFVREDGPGLFSYAPGPEAWYDPGEALGRAFGLESAGSVTHSSAGSSARSLVVPAVGVTFVGDGRTVIIDRDGTGRELARQALKRDPADTGAGRFGRVAARLGEPLVAVIAAGEHGCSGTGQENARLLDHDAQLARAVGELHPYEAFGAGYQRLAEDAPPTGRYVFDYARRHQATDVSRAAAHSPSRACLPTAGVRTRRPPSRSGRAEVDGHDLVLDVDPVLDPPTVLFDELWGRPYGQSGVFAICGPPSTWRVVTGSAPHRRRAALRGSRDAVALRPARQVRLGRGPLRGGPGDGSDDVECWAGAVRHTPRTRRPIRCGRRALQRDAHGRRWRGGEPQGGCRGGLRNSRVARGLDVPRLVRDLRAARGPRPSLPGDRALLPRAGADHRGAGIPGGPGQGRLDGVRGLAYRLAVLVAGGGALLRSDPRGCRPAGAHHLPTLAPAGRCCSGDGGPLGALHAEPPHARDGAHHHRPAGG